MIKTNRKIRMFLLSIMAIAVFAVPQTAMASSTGNTAINVSVPASVISFTITESITFTGTANSVDATVGSVTLENTMSAGSISATMKLENKTGWTAKAYTTAWENETVGSKSYGLKADSTKDMYETISGTEYSTTTSLQAGESDVTTLTGKIPIQNTALTSAAAANLVTTVDWA